MTFPEQLQAFIQSTASLEVSELLTAYQALTPEDQQKLIHYAQKLAAPSPTASDTTAEHDVLSDADEEEVRRILSLFGHR